MVGPNGAGKTNVLEVFRFLADIVRTDLEPALERRGGLESLLFRGDRADDFLQIDLSGTGTRRLWRVTNLPAPPWPAKSDSFSISRTEPGD
ncbi:AAA family ATPase [Acrocarpospora macrocephala]|uniref:AAA family ATPase n=1 Tax=Acrocarpospora macrocephala TaxID=150177 RepID=UPI001FE58967|nr:AAA family ATPase [Acrocarpospora macrocephala]